MNSFDALAKKVCDQLTDNHLEPCNFYYQAREAKRQISVALSANDIPAERAAIAAFGGVVKRWRGWLIEILSDVALAECDTSRAGVRGWQKRLFGRSVASSKLKRFAKSERSGGGRAAPLTVPEEIEQQAVAFYRYHKDAIKLV